MTHPKNVYLRESDVASRLDRWLGRLFAPSNVARALEALAVAGDVDRPEAAELVALRIPVSRPRRLDRDRLAAVLAELGDMVDLLDRADPEGKAKISTSLGLKPVFHPGKRKVLVASLSDQDPMGCQFVSEGGLEPPCPAKGTSTSS